MAPKNRPTVMPSFRQVIGHGDGGQLEKNQEVRSLLHIVANGATLDGRECKNLRTNWVLVT